MRRIKALLPRDRVGDLEMPVFWPNRWAWLQRSPWWVALPVMMLWAPIGLLLHLPVMAMWWEEERRRQR